MINKPRGFFGIGIENGKNSQNINCLLRSAHCLGAAFTFVIGNRYKKSKADTTKSYRNIPLFEYEDIFHFYHSTPKDTTIIAVEFPNEQAASLYNFVHPERAIYLLGAEDCGLSLEALAFSNYILKIDSRLCLNVGVSGSIIMYDRLVKENKRQLNG